MGGNNHPRIAVVGGGIFGSFAAYFLCRLEAEVTLIERDGIARHSSSRNPGGLNPMHGTGIPGPMHEFALQSLRLHKENWQEIGRLSGKEFSPKFAPRIHLAFDPSDLGPLEKIHAIHAAAPGFSARWIERDELLALEPGLNPAVLRGVWTEGNAKVAAGAYSEAIARAAVAHGAKILQDEVIGLGGEAPRATHLVLRSGELACDGIVLATGAWGAESSRWLHCPIPIKPLKGDLLIVKTAEGPPIRHNYAWRDAAVYGTGSPEFWLGGTEEEAGFDCVPTAAARESILSRAAHLFLRLKDAVVVQQISGLRPMTADDLPLAGFAPGWKNVCLAMGGGRKGMLYSAGVGRAVAELLAKGQTDMPIAGCSPARLTKV